MCMTLLTVSAVLEVGVGDMAKISYHVFFLEISRFYPDSLSCWFAAKIISLL